MKLSDYLAYKRRIDDLDVHTHDGPDIAEIQFKLIDLDGDGTINWWEFLSHESKRMLCNRSQVNIDMPKVNGFVFAQRV